jgi:hypothetical protein
MDTDTQRQADQNIDSDYKEVSSLAKYPFEPYWPQKALKVCVTGAGGFIASHLAKRLKSEGHYVIACDWKRNEHYSVSCLRPVWVQHGCKHTCPAGHHRISQGAGVLKRLGIKACMRSN